MGLDEVLVLRRVEHDSVLLFFRFFLLLRFQVPPSQRLELVKHVDVPLRHLLLGESLEVDLGVG